MSYANEDEQEMLQSTLAISDEMRRACEALCQLLDSSAHDAAHSEPRYVISVASRMVGIEAHRLRHYERTRVRATRPLRWQHEVVLAGGYRPSVLCEDN